MCADKSGEYKMQNTQSHELMAGRVEQAKKNKTLKSFSSSSARGSSVNFKKISSALHAVSHASREVPPNYLLPEDKSHGAHVIKDDNGEVQKRLEHKLSLASRQAKAENNYSPLWEGVINLPEPSSEFPAEKQKDMVLEWCKRYEEMTGHQVLRADLHLDEGYINDHDETKLNAHAHVMCDRTDEKGRVIKLSPKQLREIQTMTAEVTQLERGENSRQSGRKHIEHQAFRYLAEKGRLAPNKDKQTDELRDEIERLKAEYLAEREEMKATAEAKQKDYQALKEAHQKALAALQKAKPPATTADKLGGAYIMALVGQLQAAKVAPEKLDQIVEKYTTAEERSSYEKLTESEMQEGLTMLKGPEHKPKTMERLQAVFDREFGRGR
jgi:surfactin synthase thioesterase subunit